MKDSRKQNFYHSSFQESKDNPRELWELWKKVKELIPDKNSTNINEIHDDNGSVVSDKKGIANTINISFVNIGAKISIYIF